MIYEERFGAGELNQFWAMIEIGAKHMKDGDIELKQLESEIVDFATIGPPTLLEGEPPSYYTVKFTPEQNRTFYMCYGIGLAHADIKCDPEFDIERAIYQTQLDYAKQKIAETRATCKRLVCYLAEHVGKKPTRAKIAMDVGCGLNLVNDCIKMLKNANLINIDKNRCIVRVDDSAAVSFFDTHLPNA